IAKTSSKVKVRVLEAAKIKPPLSSSSLSPSKAGSGGAKLVVLSPFLFVSQHFVGFGDFFKFGFIALTGVRVMLLSELTVGFFNVIFCGVFFYAQGFVIVHVF